MVETQRKPIARDAYGADEGDPRVHITKGPGGDTYCQRDPRPGDAIADGTKVSWQDESISPDGLVLLGVFETPRAICWVCLQHWELTCDRCGGYGFECECPCTGCVQCVEATGDPDSMCMDCVGSMVEAAEREAGWDPNP